MRIKAFWFLIILSASCAGAQPELRDGCNNTREIKDILITLRMVEETAENIQTILESADCTASNIDQIIRDLTAIESRLVTLENGSAEPCCATAQQIESLLEIIASKVPTIAANDCCSQIEQLLGVLEEVDDRIDSKIEHLVASSCCEQINEALSLIQIIDHGIDEILGLACASTLIFDATVIAAPGNYCLAQEIAGQIGIGSDDVNLDLNGFTIDAGVTNGLLIAGSNITVHNGFITSDGTEPAILVTDIFTAAPANLLFKDLTISMPGGTLSSGIAIVPGTSAVFCDSVVIDSVIVDGGGFGIDFFNVTNSTVQNSLFANYSIAGARLRGASSGNKIENCVANGGTAVAARGFWLDGGTSPDNPSSNILIECVAMNNTNVPSNVGFFLGNGTDPAGDNNCLIRCIADSNTIGFGVSPATGIQLFKECIASNNLFLGFADDGTESGIQYIANTSKFNGTTPGNPATDTNYDSRAVGTLPYFQKLIPFGPGSPVSYWTNVTIP